MVKQGINTNNANIIIQVAKEFGIDPAYIATIGLSENIRNPRAVGDAGCSVGAYQFNLCVGTRIENTEFGMKYEDCAKDVMCATKMVAIRIRDEYDCNFDNSGRITNRQQCLSRHHGWNYATWYARKIAKNGTLLGIITK